MKNTKTPQNGRSRKLIVVLAFAVAALAVSVCLYANKATTVQALDEPTYAQVKQLVHTPGTSLTTVKLSCTDGRIASGTLVRNSDFEVIITAVHYFATHDSVGTYTYLVAGKEYPIHSVFSHPRPGPVGERDVAFCFPGTSRKVRTHAKMLRDTTYTNLKVDAVPVMSGIKLDGNIPVTINGILFRDSNNPLYLLPCEFKDGDSGSGIICDKRFFVLDANIPVGSDKIGNILGVQASKFTIATEL